MLNPAIPEQEPLGRRILWTEVLVLLFLIVPSMLLSFFAVKTGHLGFVLTAWATMVRDAGLVALILYFLWRNGETFRHIGWTPRHVNPDIILGILLFVPFFFVTAWLDQLLRSLGLSSPPEAPTFLQPQGPGQLVLGVVLVSVVAVAEETLFRGYLIHRLETLTRSTSAAVWLSAFVFALGHGYEGASGVVTVGVMGLIFGVIYVWRRSLVAPMVIHFLQDFIGIVLAPLLQRGS